MTRSRRGEYRAIHVVLVDGPDYQALTPEAKLLLLTLKLSLGPYQIGVVPALGGTLMERTGLTAGQVAAGLTALQSAGWVAIERSVVWVIRGLEFEPSLAPNNKLHRAGLAAYVAGLPRLPIVARFAARYGDQWGLGYPSDSHANGYAMPMPSTEDRRQKTETEDREGRVATSSAEPIPEQPPTAGDVPTEAVVALLPVDYRDDLRSALRGCHRPDALLREVRLLCAGKHPQAEGATPPDVGQGLRELILSGRSLNALPRWVAPVLKRRREEERTERARAEERVHERRKRAERTVERGGPLTPLAELLPKLGIVKDGAA